jgi:hypothetical protein
MEMQPNWWIYSLTGLNQNTIIIPLLVFSSVDLRDWIIVKSLYTVKGLTTKAEALTQQIIISNTYH